MSRNQKRVRVAVLAGAALTADWIVLNAAVLQD